VIALTAKAMAEVQTRFGPFDAAVGHSFGGAALMAASGGSFPGIATLAAERFAVIGSPSRIDEVLATFVRIAKLTPATASALIRLTERRVGCPASALDGVPIARRLGKPLLVVHAEDDKEVAVDHARRYASAGPHVRFHWANGYGHRRIVSAREVMEGIVAFLRDDADSAAA